MISLRVGMTMERDELLRRLVDIRYERNDIAFERNMFRVRGDTVELWPAYWKDAALRVEFFGDEIDRISEINVVTGAPIRQRSHVPVWPATHYVTPKDKMDAAIQEIYKELEERVKYFTDRDQLVEAQRIKQRVMYDVEMMQELGYCSGIENYSRVIAGRPAGSPPMTLLDYFPKDFVLFIDESHVTLPQVRAMYNGDRARKTALVDYGFRLPCAFDNRPLKFEEFEQRLNQVVYVSATPGEYERVRSGQIVEQVIRPTGLLDPVIEVRPVAGQIDDLIGEINQRTQRDERVLVTTLTKKMAESLTGYLRTAGIRVRYMHHDIDTIERMEIIRDLRLGEFDVLVGINLLREGLDLPEVSLVAILDADKEGFLRSETSLIQTIGRAARNAEGLVILYADTVTPSMAAAMEETQRRREIQDAYNQAHGIVPKTIVKSVRDLIEISHAPDGKGKKGQGAKALTQKEKANLIANLEKEMKEASRRLDTPFGIVDLSLAPTPAVGDSVARILEEMGLEVCGTHGTTAALALLNDAVKKGGVMASSSVGGLSGAFIPVSEDEGMIAAAEAGTLCLDKLEAMTCVCSVGLDMIAVPGDTPVETISAIIADEAAIGMVNNKTTAVRLLPAPGKTVGDRIEMGGLLGSAPVMPVHPESSADFIARGGRIPAPLHSLKN